MSPGANSWEHWLTAEHSCAVFVLQHWVCRANMQQPCVLQPQKHCSEGCPDGCTTCVSEFVKADVCTTWVRLSLVLYCCAELAAVQVWLMDKLCLWLMKLCCVT